MGGLGDQLLGEVVQHMCEITPLLSWLLGHLRRSLRRPLSQILFVILLFEKTEGSRWSQALFTIRTTLELINEPD